MGALPKLKQKIEYQYRKGSTDESKNCKNCEYFKAHFPIFGIGGDGTPIKIESRCAIMGMGEGRRYRIRPDHTCNVQVMSQSYKDYISRMRSGVA